MAELTHDEIWDDSALVDSWNEALEEYKKYHSIHARGGKLEDRPEPSTATSADAKPETGEAVPEHGGGTISKSHPEITDASKTQAPGDGVQAPIVAEQQDSQGAGGPVPPPQLLLGSVQDEGLKKMLMSWYYAGYYTGVFEGRQQGQQPQ